MTQRSPANAAWFLCLYKNTTRSLQQELNVSNFITRNIISLIAPVGRLLTIDHGRLENVLCRKLVRRDGENRHLSACGEVLARNASWEWWWWSNFVCQTFSRPTVWFCRYLSCLTLVKRVCSSLMSFRTNIEIECGSECVMNPNKQRECLITSIYNCVWSTFWDNLIFRASLIYQYLKPYHSIYVYIYICLKKIILKRIVLIIRLLRKKMKWLKNLLVDLLNKHKIKSNFCFKGINLW